MLDLVSQTNIYLSRGRSSTNVRAVLAVSEWVTRMLRMFGLGEGSPVEGPTGERVVGWGTAPEPGQEDAGVDVRLCCLSCAYSHCRHQRETDAYDDLATAQRDAVLMPYLRALSSFRDQVRQLAMSNAASSDILALCDRLRDEEMVELGVALDDQDGASCWSRSPSRFLGPVQHR